MTTTETSPDGTQIAFDQLGHGPPVVVGGMFSDRRTTQELAEQLGGSSPSSMIESIDPQRPRMGASPE